MSDSNARGSRPLVRVAISPKNGDARSGLQRALEDIAREDPTVGIVIDPVSNQVSVRGMDESQLQQICDRIQHEHKIDIEIGEPTVVYVETIREVAVSEGKYIRQVGGCGNYAHVKLTLEPNEPDKGFEFINAIQGSVLPRKYINATARGIEEALLNGVLAGHEMVDLKATLYDGSYHDIDSNESAFKIAATTAFKEAVRKASPVLLEPIMAIEIMAPEKETRKIIADITSLRGTVTGIDRQVASQVIHATAPLAEMLGYAKRTRSNSLEPVECSMRFIRYAESPSGESGDNEAGVAAKKPDGPKPRHGFAAADLDTEET